MTHQFLDLSPIRPPKVSKYPVGRSLDFLEVVRDAGMRNVVTMPRLPDLRLHGGESDFKAFSQQGPVYCLAGPLLPSEPRKRAIEILRRLAYGFGDYTAREIVSRHHRDIARTDADPSDDSARKLRRALSETGLKIKRLLRIRGELTISEIAEATGISQPNVSRTAALMAGAGLMSMARRGRHQVCRLTDRSPSPPTDAALSEPEMPSSGPR